MYVRFYRPSIAPVVVKQAHCEVATDRKDILLTILLSGTNIDDSRML